MLELIIGPMFSGKTTELLRRIKRHKLAKKNVMLLRYSGDIRYAENGVCTHDGISLNCINVKDLNEIKLRDNIEVIGIDEGQFIDNLSITNEWCNKGIKVIIAGLDSDFLTNPFDNIVNLIPKAERIDKLTAICDCGGDASFTKRIISSKEVEVIGGSEAYKAVCRTCYKL